MPECKPVSTPIIISKDRMYVEESENYDVNEYQKLIGELLYLANRTRLRSWRFIYHNIIIVHKSGIACWVRVLRYLNGSKYKLLEYDRKFGLLKAYSDSSWGNTNNKKSF